MTRRRLFLALPTILVIAILASIIWYPSVPRPCLATFKQVRVVLSRAQVITTVGRPPGDYTTREWFNYDYANGLRYTNYEWWICDEGCLVVRFGDNDYPASAWPPSADSDRVTNVAILNIALHQSTFFERIRKWLRL